MFDRKYTQPLKQFFDIRRKMKRGRYLIFFGGLCLAGTIYILLVGIFITTFILMGGAISLGNIYTVYLDSIVKLLIVLLYLLFSLRRINDIGVSRYWIFIFIPSLILIHPFLVLSIMQFGIPKIIVIWGSILIPAQILLLSLPTLKKT